MSIIIVSSDSHELGLEIARKTAARLNYGLAGREILDKVSKKYNIDNKKLARVLEEPPAVWALPSKLWNRYMAYIQEAVLAELVKDNVVCQGLSARLYVLGISHALRVRVLEDPENEIAQLTRQGGISRAKAEKLIERRKNNRRRWSMQAFGLDETDASQYDLAISLSQIDSDEAVKIITDTVAYRRFNPMTYSISCIQDLELAGRVRAALLDEFPDIRVKARNGTLVVETKVLRREKKKKTEAIKKSAGEVPGVEYVEVHAFNDFFRQAAESFR